MSFGPVFRPDPRTAFRVVVAGGFLLMLASSMPGHISSDSLIQLSQARHHVRALFRQNSHPAERDCMNGKAR